MHFNRPVVALQCIHVAYMRQIYTYVKNHRKSDQYIVNSTIYMQYLLSIFPGRVFCKYYSLMSFALILFCVCLPTPCMCDILISSCRQKAYVQSNCTFRSYMYVYAETQIIHNKIHVSRPRKNIYLFFKIYLIFNIVPKSLPAV